MHARPQLLVLVFAVTMSLVVFRLVRRQLLRDRFGLVWVLICAATTTVAVVPADWWDAVARLLGIKSEAPTLFFVLAIFGLLGLVLQLSLALSRTERRLVQSTVHDAVASWLRDHPDELDPRGSA